jgi:hypothetical protein
MEWKMGIDLTHRLNEVTAKRVYATSVLNQLSPKNQLAIQHSLDLLAIQCELVEIADKVECTVDLEELVESEQNQLCTIRTNLIIAASLLKLTEHVNALSLEAESSELDLEAIRTNTLFLSAFLAYREINEGNKFVGQLLQRQIDALQCRDSL